MLKGLGIICEYNPFHNGHLYHLQYIKQNYPNHIIILILSGFFTQRGTPSILSKADKTKIALEAGVDLVIELPFAFTVQNADIFAKGAISLLNELKVEKIVFGSECNDINLLKNLSDIKKTDKFNKLTLEYEKKGNNYPTSISKAFKDICKYDISNPNDLLALSYIDVIKNLKANIEPISIKRTNDYHSLDCSTSIISASAIRNLIENNKPIEKFVPNYVLKYKVFNPDYFNYLKFKILSEKEFLNIYSFVDEGIENRIIKNINTCKTIDELIKKIKTKRYTFNRINRMFIHILCSFTKEEANKFKHIEYIRILGLNNKGKSYLKQIKKEVNLPIVSKFSSINNDMLKLEQRVTSIYAYITSNNYLNEEEYKVFPIIH